MATKDTGVATITFTRPEAVAVLSAIGAAISANNGEVPSDVADSLYWAIQKFEEAFGVMAEVDGKKTRKRRKAVAK